MNRTAQKRTKIANPGSDRSELRALRKRVTNNSQSGQGHGQTIYRPIATMEDRQAEAELRRNRRSIVKRIGDIWHALGIETHAPDDE